jgi:Fe2+ or Zn2+ uptake regulation protein
MFSQPQYRSSKSRITKQQEHYSLVTEQIIEYIKKLTEPKDAESIWFGMRSEDYRLSIATFNNRLKKLVEAGLIEKISVGYNKHLYQVKK